MIMTKESHPKLFKRLRALRIYHEFAKKQIIEKYTINKKLLTSKQYARNQMLMQMELSNVFGSCK